MGGTAYQTILVYEVLPLVGICLIAFAIISQKTLSGREVMNLTASRLGIALKVNAFALLVLIGFVMSGSAIFLIYRGYEAKLQTLQKKVDSMELSMNNTIKEMNDALSVFKDIDLRLTLRFPQDDQPNDPFKTDVTVYVGRGPTAPGQRYNLISIEPGSGGISVRIFKLRLGDSLYVIAKYGDKVWRSNTMTTPSADLTMRSE